MYTNHRIDRDSHWQQFGTQPILISAPQWACWPCNAPTRFYTVGKKPSVKADQAIYSQAVDVRGRCMSESLKLGHNLDFSSCDIMIGFHKSSHIYDQVQSFQINDYANHYVDIEITGYGVLYSESIAGRGIARLISWLRTAEPTDCFNRLFNCISIFFNFYW